MAGHRVRLEQHAPAAEPGAPSEVDVLEVGEIVVGETAGEAAVAAERQEANVGKLFLDRADAAVGRAVVNHGDAGAGHVAELLRYRGDAGQGVIAAVPVDDDDVGDAAQGPPPMRRLSRVNSVGRVLNPSL